MLYDYKCKSNLYFMSHDPSNTEIHFESNLFLYCLREYYQYL